LLSKRNWKQWPSDMYWARAVGRMGRRFGSDLLGGLVYTKEELEDVDDYEGGYGGDGAGYETTTKREIDPGKDLMTGAVAASTKEAVDELNAKMHAVNNHVDWPALIGLCVKAQFEVENRSELTEGLRNEWWLRLRNAVAKLETFEFDGETAASPVEVKTAFVWAFPKFDGDIPMLETPVEVKAEADDEPAPLPTPTDEEKARLEEEAQSAQFGD